MPQCEMCGKSEEKLKEAIVEGTILDVCSTCSSYGNIVMVDKPKYETENLVQKDITIEDEKEIEVVIPEAGLTIKNEREKKGMKQDELAKMLAEKSSTISAIEQGKGHLPIKLAKKFEQFFNIKLIARGVEVETPKTLDISDSDVTIGDLIKYKKKS